MERVQVIYTEVDLKTEVNQRSSSNFLIETRDVIHR